MLCKLNFWNKRQQQRGMKELSKEKFIVFFTSSWSNICCFSFSASWLCWLISSSWKKTSCLLFLVSYVIFDILVSRWQSDTRILPVTLPIRWRERCSASSQKTECGSGILIWLKHLVTHLSQQMKYFGILGNVTSYTFNSIPAHTEIRNLGLGNQKGPPTSKMLIVNS